MSNSNSGCNCGCLFWIIIGLFLGLLLFGCDNKDNKPHSITNGSENSIYYQVTEHIWYIKDTGQGFCERYEAFLKEDLPKGFYVKQILGDGNGPYGRDRGYFIILEEKANGIIRHNNKKI